MCCFRRRWARKGLVDGGRRGSTPAAHASWNSASRRKRSSVRWGIHARCLPRPRGVIRARAIRHPGIGDRPRDGVIKTLGSPMDISVAALMDPSPSSTGPVGRRMESLVRQLRAKPASWLASAHRRMASSWSVTILTVAVFLVGVYVIVYPFTVVTYPPITDLPFHAAGSPSSGTTSIRLPLPRAIRASLSFCALRNHDIARSILRSLHARYLGDEAHGNRDAGAVAMWSRRFFLRHEERARCGAFWG